MNYSTTDSSGLSSVASGVGAFSAISCPTWWGICRFLHAIKTNPHLYPGVGGLGVYFDWCISDIDANCAAVHTSYCFDDILIKLVQASSVEFVFE